MPVPAHLSSTAFLIADAARAAMLTALVDGSARPASELAHGAGVTPQTASSHLAKLVAGGLLTVEPEGRHRYYRLAGPQVAQALESLAAITPGQGPTRKAATRAPDALRFARCCYDHLAGELGVALTQALRDRDFLLPGDGKLFVVTAAGAEWFDRAGVDMAALTPGRRGLARQCLDWTERRHHLAGPLGVRLLGALHEKGWVRRSEASRIVTVTPRGWIGLRQELGLDRQDFARLMRLPQPSGLAGPASSLGRARPIGLGHRSTTET